jgi:hypothetical protein
MPLAKIIKKTFFLGFPIIYSEGKIYEFFICFSLIFIYPGGIRPRPHKRMGEKDKNCAVPGNGRCNPSHFPSFN